tara:strand:+ start:318 stop:929 length:612 start_codon:yes stop_codon:yes gene_type:complete
MGGLSTAANIGTGIGTAVGARKEKDRLEDELARIRRNRGLSAPRRAQLEAAGQSAQIGVERATQAAQAEQLAAQAATGGGVSGRDIFLREQATQQARQGAAIAGGQQVLEADLAARAEQANQMAQIRSGIGAAEQQRVAGITQAVTGGLAGGAALAGEAVRQEDIANAQQFDLKKLKAELGALNQFELQKAALGGAPSPLPYR